MGTRCAAGTWAAASLSPRPCPGGDSRNARSDPLEGELNGLPPRRDSKGRLLSENIRFFRGKGCERNIVIPHCGICVCVGCIGTYVWLLESARAFGGRARGI